METGTSTGAVCTLLGLCSVWTAASDWLMISEGGREMAGEGGTEGGERGKKEEEEGKEGEEGGKEEGRER